MTSSLRSFVRIALCGALIVSGALVHVAAKAQDRYPSHPVTLVVGFSAGGPADAVGRVIANQMAEVLGGQIVVDNRTGAGGNIGAAFTAKARPDGYTILLATVVTQGWNSALYDNLPFDPIKDFAPIGLVSSSPSTLLVADASPFRTVQQLIDFAKANPRKLNYGSGGVGSTQHLAGANFAHLAGIDVVHVPYKGTAPAMADLMGGTVDMIITTGASAFVRGGRVRALAVADHQRLASLPDVPTFDEVGFKGFYTDSWYGLIAPAGTPRPILEQLNAALVAALQKPELRKQFSDMGTVPAKPMSNDAFWTFVKDQMPAAAALVRVSGAKAD